MHFADAPDQTRSANSSGSQPAGRGAGHHVRSVEAKDGSRPRSRTRPGPGRAIHRAWPHGSLAHLAHKLGIEIEAALASAPATRHHARCLLLFDDVSEGAPAKARARPGNSTGVLAIAAAKALRVKGAASDIDPLAVRCARHARLNVRVILVETIRATGFSARVHEAWAVRYGTGEYSCQSARQMSTQMARHLAPSALVILSDCFRIRLKA